MWIEQVCPQAKGCGVVKKCRDCLNDQTATTDGSVGANRPDILICDMVKKKTYNYIVALLMLMWE